jgi:hypothetical protein
MNYEILTSIPTNMLSLHCLSFYQIQSKLLVQLRTIFVTFFRIPKQKKFQFQKKGKKESLREKRYTRSSVWNLISALRIICTWNVWDIFTYPTKHSCIVFAINYLCTWVVFEVSRLKEKVWLSCFKRNSIRLHKFQYSHACTRADFI